MTVRIDESLCTGCSLCVSEVPEVFELGSEGLAVVINASPAGDLLAKAKDAVTLCPSSAIQVD